MPSSSPATIPPPASSLTLPNNHLKHFASGLIGGSLSAIVLQPADLLKTRVQQSSSSTLTSTIRTILASPSPIPTLWRGAIPSAIRTGVGSGFYFATLNVLRRATTSYSSQQKPSTLNNLLTGATSRVIAGFLMMPITIIKVRYESTIYSYSSILQATGDIWRTEGIRGFFSGFGATAIRDGPYAGIYVSFYEGSKGVYTRLLSSSKFLEDGVSMAMEQVSTNLIPEMKASTSTLVNLSAGLTAGALATAVTNPFDALKTRIQLFPDTYTNLWVAARKVVGEEGIWALFDGLGLRMGRKALSSAVAWTAYEESMRRWAVAARKKQVDVID